MKSSNEMRGREVKGWLRVDAESVSTREHRALGYTERRLPALAVLEAALVPAVSHVQARNPPARVLVLRADLDVTSASRASVAGQPRTAPRDDQLRQAQPVIFRRLLHV